jgi:O-antigen/teichoic acid export membrane protein
MQLVMVAVVWFALLGAWLCARSAVAGVVGAMVAATPFLLLREFARRMAYADLSPPKALAIDMPVVTVQVMALALLAGTGRLSATSAVLALGSAAAIGALIGAVGWRARIAVSAHHVAADLRGDLRRSWRFGRWIAGAQLLGLASTQGTFWLVALVLDSARTGIYAACLAIVFLCNPFLLAVGNVLTPRAAQTLARDGPAALRRLIWRVAGILAATMALFAVALGLWGDRVVWWLYGPEYAGHGMLIFVLAIMFLVSAVGMAVNDGIRALGRADIEFAATAIDSVFALGLGLVGLMTLGLIGLAGASLIGSIAALAFQTVVFGRLLRAAAKAWEAPQPS